MAFIFRGFFKFAAPTKKHVAVYEIISTRCFVFGCELTAELSLLFSPVLKDTHTDLFWSVQHNWHCHCCCDINVPAAAVRFKGGE